MRETVNPFEIESADPALGEHPPLQFDPEFGAWPNDWALNAVVRH